MRHFFLFHLFVFCGFLSVLGFSIAPHAFAQDSAPAPAAETAPAAPLEDLSKIPDEYFEEAEAFLAECDASYVMARYYNCDCASLAYLNTRIELGPYPNKSKILREIQGECRDAVGMAGELYDKCLRKANRFAPGTDPEKYCECVANSYVDMMNDLQPSVDSRTIVQFQTVAYSQCRDKPQR